MGCNIKMKKVNKIVFIVLIGFYLRYYLESLFNKVYLVVELEFCNVCCFIMSKYLDENINLLIYKLKLIKIDICNVLMIEMIVFEIFIRYIIIKY